MKLTAQVYQVWHDFRIKLSSEIKFEPNYLYLFTGDNGAGKTSFLRKVILPELQKSKEFFPAYLSQDFAHQYYSIKAYSVYDNNNSVVNNFSEAINYYLQRLSNDISKDKIIFLMLDEAEVYHKLKELTTPLKNHQVIFLLITHNPEILSLFSRKSDEKNWLKALFPEKKMINMAFSKTKEDESRIDVEIYS